MGKNIFLYATTTPSSLSSGKYPVGSPRTKLLSVSPNPSYQNKEYQKLLSQTMDRITTAKPTKNSLRIGGFPHVTSRLRYPQSNGFIERQVQTVKHTLDKAQKCGKDPTMVMLCLRSTPIDSQVPSPTELLFQCKLKSNLPIRIKNQMPDRDHVTQKLIERQENMKYYHDRNAHDLSPLATGQHVSIQDHSTKKWIPGTVKYRRPDPGPTLCRQNLVEISGATDVTFAHQHEANGMTSPQFQDARNPLLKLYPVLLLPLQEVQQ